MKKLYPVIIASLIIIVAIPPLKSSAQCNCAPAVPATPITYVDTVLPTQASKSPFSFPQFNPTIGQLSCVEFNDTASIVVTTFVRNTDTTAGQTYIFQTSITLAVVGPQNSGPFDWLATYRLTNKDYGPVFLDQDMIDLHPPQPRLPGDSATFGPDTIVNNAIGAASPPDLTPFIGMGNVNFSANLSGGATAALGGVNYQAGIKSNTWGTFRLTYYWCPAVVLASTITNFMAIKSGNGILLKWIEQNEQTNTSYEIEYSKDGSSYMPVGTIQSISPAGKVNVPYQFQYPLTPSDAGKIYFRVKRTDELGKATYTPIKEVDLGTLGISGYQVYPNPVQNTVMLEFDAMQTASFIVSLINTTGQVIQQKQVVLSGGNQIRFDLNRQPAAGLYYLQAVDQTHNQQYVTKVFIK